MNNRFRALVLAALLSLSLIIMIVYHSLIIYMVAVVVGGSIVMIMERIPVIPQMEGKVVRNP